MRSRNGCRPYFSLGRARVTAIRRACKSGCARALTRRSITRGTIRLAKRARTYIRRAMLRPSRRVSDTLTAATAFCCSAALTCRRSLKRLRAIGWTLIDTRSIASIRTSIIATRKTAMQRLRAFLRVAAIQARAWDGLPAVRFDAPPLRIEIDSIGRDARRANLALTSADGANDWRCASCRAGQHTGAIRR